MKTNQPKIEETLQLGEEYAAKSPENAASALAQNVKTLKQKWDAALTKANDRKVRFLKLRLELETKLIFLYFRQN